MDQSTNDYVKNAVEAILFVSEKPVPLDQIREALETVQNAEIVRALRDLKNEYEDNRRGMVIMEIANGYQMLSSPYFSTVVRQYFKKKVKEKLSKPSLETMAIVAYKQPVSRGDIEVIRGVNSDGVVTHLLNKGLIKIIGRKDVPGRPFLYGTTKQFLEYFGLKSLSDLPKLQDFPALVEATEGDLPEEQSTESEGTAEENPSLAETDEESQDEKTEKSENESTGQESETEAPRANDREFGEPAGPFSNVTIDRAAQEEEAASSDGDDQESFEKETDPAAPRADDSEFGEPAGPFSNVTSDRIENNEADPMDDADDAEKTEKATQE